MVKLTERTFTRNRQ